MEAVGSGPGAGFTPETCRELSWKQPWAGAGAGSGRGSRAGGSPAAGCLTGFPLPPGSPSWLCRSTSPKPWQRASCRARSPQPPSAPCLAPSPSDQPLPPPSSKPRSLDRPFSERHQPTSAPRRAPSSSRPTRAARPPRVRPPRGLHAAARRARAGCSSGWWETVVVDINPGFSFASSGLLPRQSLASPAEHPGCSPRPRRPRAQQRSPSHGCVAQGRGWCLSHQDPFVARGRLPLGPLVSCSSPSQLPDWKKRSWGKEHPSGRPVPASPVGRELRGSLSPALTGRNDPSASGKLAVPLSDGAG